jgi:hypothetical protein
MSSISESESSRSRRDRKDKSRKDKKKGRDGKDAKENKKSRRDKKEVKKNKKLSNADEERLNERKVHQESEIKNIGEDDLTPKIERKDGNIEHLESGDLRVEEKNINFVEDGQKSDNLNDVEKIQSEKIQDVNMTENQKDQHSESETSMQLALFSNHQEENKNEQGIELRSRVLGEESTSRNAVEVYTGFKKINYLDIPNVHRKL